MNTTDKRGERERQLKERAYLKDGGTPPAAAGRDGGTLQRDVASRDEMKRAFERPGGATRVRKGDEVEPGS